MAKKPVIPKEAWFSIPIDTDTQPFKIEEGNVTPEQSAAFDAYMLAQEKAKRKRLAFEQTMAVDVPKGKKMVFVYQFLWRGTLSLALVDDDGESGTETKKTNKGSLADFLKKEGIQPSDGNGAAVSDDDDDDDDEGVSEPSPPATRAQPKESVPPKPNLKELFRGNR
jgi:hypothetical protein